MDHGLLPTALHCLKDRTREKDRLASEKDLLASEKDHLTSEKDRLASEK